MGNTKHGRQIIDADVHFTIDPVTRNITNNTPEKNTILQGDHNSERFTFKIPRYIDGHDMLTCNNVRVPYINAEVSGRDKKHATGSYLVADLELDPTNDKFVTCSWLISKNATGYAGVLNFAIVFSCMEDNIVIYRWKTNIFESIYIAPDLDTNMVLEVEYLDVIEQWKDSVKNEFSEYFEASAKQHYGEFKDVLHGEMMAEFEVMQDSLDASFKAQSDSLDEVIDGFDEILRTEITNMDSEIDVLEARMDTFASLPNGTTSGNAELLDIRVGADGTTYASAGRAVREQIEDLTSELVEHHKTIAIEKEYEFSNIGYVSVEGRFFEDANGRHTGFIPIAGLSKLLYSCNLSGTAYGVSFFDAAKNLIPDLCVVGGSNSTMAEIDLSAGDYMSATYLVVSHYVNNRTPYCKTIPNDESLIYDLRNKVEPLLDLPQAVSDLSLEFINDAEHVFTEQGYISSEGKLLDPTESMNTGYIPLNGIVKIDYIGWMGTGGYALAFYTADKQLLADISVAGDNGRTVLEINVTDDLYTDAKYVIASHYKSTSMPEPYCKTIAIEDNVAKKVMHIQEALCPTEGKTALFFGDSITETATVSDDGSEYVEGTRKNWPTYAKDMLKLGAMWNFAKSGAAYKDRTGVLERQKIGVQINSAISSGRSADIIVISAGTNDGSSGFGDYETAMSKATLDDLDRTKLYEAIRWAMWKVRATYPDATCFAATPIQRADHEPNYALTEAITKMAKRYNFIIIPAQDESGIVKENEVWNAEGHDLIDGLHPNENGQKKMANLYSRYIMNAFIRQWS